MSQASHGDAADGTRAVPNRMRFPRERGGPGRSARLPLARPAAVQVVLSAPSRRRFGAFAGQLVSRLVPYSSTRLWFASRVRSAVKESESRIWSSVMAEVGVPLHR